MNLNLALFAKCINEWATFQMCIFGSPSCLSAFIMASGRFYLKSYFTFYLRINPGGTSYTRNCLHLQQNCIIYLKDHLHFLEGSWKDIMFPQHDSQSLNCLLISPRRSFVFVVCVFKIATLFYTSKIRFFITIWLHIVYWFDGNLEDFSWRI